MTATAKTGGGSFHCGPIIVIWLKWGNPKPFTA
jgi:hypothetical protein